jgi:hypothetical protein
MTLSAPDSQRCDRSKVDCECAKVPKVEADEFADQRSLHKVVANDHDGLIFAPAPKCGQDVSQAGRDVAHAFAAGHANLVGALAAPVFEEWAKSLTHGSEVQALGLSNIHLDEARASLGGQPGGGGDEFGGIGGTAERAGEDKVDVLFSKSRCGRYHLGAPVVCKRLVAAAKPTVITVVSRLAMADEMDGHRPGRSSRYWP